MKPEYTYWTRHEQGRLMGTRRIPSGHLGSRYVPVLGYQSVSFRDYVAAKRELAARRKRERQEAKRA